MSFSAAVCCFAVGSIGWLINTIAPGSTSLSALLVVAGIFLVIGVSSGFQSNSAAGKPAATSSALADDTADDQETCDEPRVRQRSVA